VVEAAPAVVFGTGDEAAGYWVAVDVADFFYELAGGEGVEVVVTGLPELFTAAFEEFGGFAFDDSEEGGEGVSFWFAGEEVNVLGHEDVGVDGEVVGVAGLFDDSFEDVFGVGVFEKGETVVATEGDEVELAGGLAAFEAQWHGWILAGVVGKAVRASLECPLML
jgi:hypothetical protein